VLTTGFDAPLTDVIAVVRPTQSTALHVQILGRGMRLFPGKNNCMVLDYGGNIARHGPIADVQVKSARKGKGKGVAPTRICPQCYAENNARASTCVECDTPLVTDEEKRANAEASALDPMVGNSKPETHDVGHVSARVHVGKESGRTSLAVSFLDTAWQPIATEYVCLEHDGYAQQKAHRWWRAFVDDAPPATCEEGAAAIKAGRMRQVLTLTTKRDGKYKRIVSATFGERPAREPGQDDAAPEEAPRADHVLDDDDIPF
jgi:DNA repair protein RadD